MEQNKIDMLVDLLNELEVDQMCFNGGCDRMNCPYGIVGIDGGICAIEVVREGIENI